MVRNGFWSEFRRPILAISPMDGLTDAAARRVAARIRPPDLTLTEFVTVEGLRLGAVVLLDDLLYDEIERPVIAQLYGSQPAAFREVAAIVCALGFDGIDINMGCPAPNIAKRGAGAALIRTPELAREIIRAVRAGIDDWANGGSLDALVSHPRIRTAVAARARRFGDRTRRQIPVSVKTRLGFADVVVDWWTGVLAEEQPAAVTLHGRTLTQLYSGSANWDAIARGAEVLHAANILALGNGDLQDRSDALRRISAYGLDGALIGRASIGNPWALLDAEVDLPTRFQTALAHIELFAELFPKRPLVGVRRHLYGYCRGFAGAPELRRCLMLANDVESCRRLLLQTPAQLAA